MKSKIALEEVIDGKSHWKTVNKDYFYQGLITLAKSNPYNTELQKLLEVIPRVIRITINRDINKNVGIPFITYKMRDALNEDVFNISHDDEVVWKRIESYIA